VALNRDRKGTEALPPDISICLVYHPLIAYNTLQILWENITAGDRHEFSEAYKLLYERFYNYGLRLTDDLTLVEDAIQEVLLYLWTDRDKLPAITNPDAYFYCLFRRALVKRIKGSMRQVAFETAAWEPEFSAEAIIIKKEANQELKLSMQSAIASLTPRQREAIFLRFYEGLSYEEVAATLDISVKATYKVVARALLSLKDKVSLPTLTVVLLLVRIS
jgi:RNA polymerase sigma factor (sigma-70 family)